MTQRYQDDGELILSMRKPNFQNRPKRSSNMLTNQEEDRKHA